MFNNIVARTAAVSMTVYITSRAGVWGPTEESDRLYQAIIKGLQPLRRLLPAEVPDEMNMGQLAREYYNRGVKGSFRFIQNLPSHSVRLVEVAKEAYLDLAHKARNPRPLDSQSDKINNSLEEQDRKVNPGRAIKKTSPDQGHRSTEVALKQLAK